MQEKQFSALFASISSLLSSIYVHSVPFFFFAFFDNIIIIPVHLRVYSASQYDKITLYSRAKVSFLLAYVMNRLTWIDHASNDSSSPAFLYNRHFQQWKILQSFCSNGTNKPCEMFAESSAAQLTNEQGNCQC